MRYLFCLRLHSSSCVTYRRKFVLFNMSDILCHLKEVVKERTKKYSVFSLADRSI